MNLPMADDLSPSLAHEPSPGDAPELGGLARTHREWAEAIASLATCYEPVPWVYPNMRELCDAMGVPSHLVSGPTGDPYDYHAHVDARGVVRMVTDAAGNAWQSEHMRTWPGHQAQLVGYDEATDGDRIYLTLDGRTYTAGSSADMVMQLRDSGYGVEESYNGVYTLTAVGSASTPWTLTRDAWPMMPGAANRQQRRAAKHGKTWQPDDRRPWEKRA